MRILSLFVMGLAVLVSPAQGQNQANDGQQNQKDDGQQNQKDDGQARQKDNGQRIRKADSANRKVTQPDQVLTRPSTDLKPGSTSPNRPQTKQAVAKARKLPANAGQKDNSRNQKDDGQQNQKDNGQRNQKDNGQQNQANNNP